MKLIQTQEELTEAISQIRPATWVSLDTEADSLHHYIEKLCLVQITVDAGDFVIDPLVPLDLTELVSVIEPKKILMQGADSDIRLLKRFYPFRPQHIFDTVIAAQLLGYPKMGLQDLAERHCGVKLSKTEQKADWAKRPLEDKLIQYASRDTQYLKAIHDAMVRELTDLGRLSWHEECCLRLLRSLENWKEGERKATAWQIKGSKNLNPSALTLLREVWIWREDLARSKDRPPFKILSTEYLLQICEWAVQNPGKDVAEWGGAPRHIKGEHRHTMNALIAGAAQMPPTPYAFPPKVKSRVVWTEKDSGRLTELKVLREAKSKELNIHPSLLATNAVLEELIVRKPKTSDALVGDELLMKWQSETWGDAILEVLKK